MATNIQAIKWPTVKVGARVLTFRMAYSAHFLMRKWALDFRTASDLEIAAAAAGTFDDDGKWHSLGISPLEFADLMDSQEMAQAVEAAAVEAVKKAFPAVAPLLQPEAGKESPEAAKTITSAYGPSALVPTGSD